MFELSVGGDVKLTFNAGDMRSSGVGLPEVIVGVCSLGKSGTLGLSAVVDDEVDGLLGKLLSVGSCVSLGEQVSVESNTRGEKSGGTPVGVASGDVGGNVRSGLDSGRCGKCHAVTEARRGSVLSAGLDADAGRLCGGGADVVVEVAELGKEGGGNVGVSGLVPGVIGVSEKTLANRKRRQDRKELKKARQSGLKRDDWRVRENKKNASSLATDVGSVPEKTELRLSLERKWAAQNAVAEEKAKQELELVKLRDVAKEAKKREVAVTRQTECNKVAIEQAFESLKATGNVPGFCATVVSDAVPTLTSGSISPNSSVSEAEVRRVVKELEDLKLENAKLKRRIRDRNISDLKGGDTVAFSADMSEGLRKEINEACDGMPTEYDVPEDPDTIYVKKYGEFQF